MKVDQELYIAKAVKVHGLKYDYSSLVYTGIKNKITFVCLTCGTSNTLRADKHLEGRGCKYCKKLETMKYTPETYIKECRKIYDNTYDFSKTVYKGRKQPVIIGCPVHNDVEVNPITFITSKKGCPKCRFKYTTEEIIEEFIKIHSDKYDYSLSKYIGYNEPLVIRCKVHDYLFKQTPFKHLKGSGCKLCSHESKILSTKEFIRRAKLIHNDLYLYDKTEYTGFNNPVDIYCKYCSVYFKQKPTLHLQGHGHDKCCNSKQYSLKELELFDYLQNYTECIHKYKPSFLKGKEIDIFIPSINLGIEYNGAYWHSIEFDDKFKTYHEDKYLSCKENGVDLLFLWDFECFESWKESLIKYIKDPRKFQISFTNILNKIGKYKTYGKSTLLLK